MRFAALILALLLAGCVVFYALNHWEHGIKVSINGVYAPECMAPMDADVERTQKVCGKVLINGVYATKCTTVIEEIYRPD